jgi:plastocyanin
MWRRASVLLLFLPAVASAHPGHGPAIVKAIDFDNRFDPQSVTVGEGDNVIWRWEGSLRNHSVTADDNSFDSDPGKSGAQIGHPANDQFTHRFTEVGTFGYHCKVHPQMFGQVTVVSVGGSDTEAPRLSAVRVSRSSRRYRLHFKLSERGDVLARIRRNRRTVRSFDVAGQTGPNRRRIPVSRLEPGRYTIVLTAFDAADNQSPTVTARLRVRRR